MHVGDAITRVGTFRVVFIRRLHTSRPIENRLSQDRPNKRAVGNLVEVPRVFVPSRDAAFSFKDVIVFRRLVRLPSVFDKATARRNVYNGDRARYLICLPTVGRLPIRDVSVRVPFPSGPAVTIRGREVRGSLLFLIRNGGNSHGRTKVEARLHRRDRSMISRLLLQSILVGTPITFSPFLRADRGLKCGDVANDLCRFRVVLRRSARRRVPNGPSFVLSYRTRLNVFRRLSNNFLFLQIRLFFR